jgi:FixJ family two-component response regulator
MSEVQILVVDDEKNVRDRFESFLTQLGYQVMCIDPGRKSLQELLALITSHHHTRMVLLDQNISGRFCGADVYLNLNHTWRQKVVAISEQLDYFIIIGGGKEVTKNFFGYKRHELALFQKELELFFESPEIKTRYNL